jgi:hypothetical protein
MQVRALIEFGKWLWNMLFEVVEARGGVGGAVLDIWGVGCASIGVCAANLLVRFPVGFWQSRLQYWVVWHFAQALRAGRLAAEAVLEQLAQVGADMLREGGWEVLED